MKNLILVLCLLGIVSGCAASAPPKTANKKAEIWFNEHKKHCPQCADPDPNDEYVELKPICEEAFNKFIEFMKEEKDKN